VQSDDIRAYSVEEAAELLNLSPGYLRRLIKAGQINVKRAGTRILVPATAIKAFLES
jgi:excisionase family DNA binding protein